MGKEQDLLQAVKCEDFNAVQRILAKVRKSKKLGSKKGQFLYQDYDGFSAMHQAALNGNNNILALLIDSHIIPLDLKDNKGMRPLHYAAWQGKLEPVRLILRAGSDPNDPAYNGDSPLHLASQYDNFSVVEMLLQYRADTSVQNEERKTPLDLACQFGRQRVVELLLNREEDLPLSYSFSQQEINSPLHLAAKNGHISIIRLLIQSGLDINTETYNGTALHEAAIFGKKEVVKLLINFGIDVNRKNSEGYSALESVNKFTSSNAAQEIKKILRDESERNSTINIVNEVWLLQDDEESGVDVNSSVESMNKKDDILLNSKVTGTSTNFKVDFTDPINSVSLLKKPCQSYENVLSDHSCTAKSFHRPHSDGIANYDHNLSQTIIFNPQRAKDQDRIYEWLKSNGLQDYTNNFTLAGYDFSTISRMTPEDLTAIGVNQPGHRKRIALMIRKLDISDGIPDFIPDNFLNWLKLLKLEHYYKIFFDNGYENLNSVIDLTWEDLQDIGITMLGHQKKIMLAVNKLSQILHNQNKLRLYVPLKGDDTKSDDLDMKCSYNTVTFFNFKKKSQQDSQESLQSDESNCSQGSNEPLQVLGGSNTDCGSNSYIPAVTSLKSLSSQPAPNISSTDYQREEDSSHLNISFSTFKQPSFHLEKSEKNDENSIEGLNTKSPTMKRTLPATPKRSNSISCTQLEDPLNNSCLFKSKDVKTGAMGHSHISMTYKDNIIPTIFKEQQIPDKMYNKPIEPIIASLDDNSCVNKHFPTKNANIIETCSSSDEKFATIRKRSSSRPRSKSFGESHKFSKHFSDGFFTNETVGSNNHTTLSYKDSSHMQETILENIPSSTKQDKMYECDKHKKKGNILGKNILFKCTQREESPFEESFFPKENTTEVLPTHTKQPKEVLCLDIHNSSSLSQINIAASLNSLNPQQNAAVHQTSDYYSQQYEQSALVLNHCDVSTFSDSDNDTESVLPFENENTDTIKKQPSKTGFEEKINRLEDDDLQTDKIFLPFNSFIVPESPEDSDLYNSIMMELHNKSQKEENNVKDQSNVFGEIDTMFDDLHDQLNSMMKFS